MSDVIFEATEFAQQVCNPIQLDVLLPVRIAKIGVMEFELTAAAHKPTQLIVNWHKFS